MFFINAFSNQDAIIVQGIQLDLRSTTWWVDTKSGVNKHRTMNIYLSYLIIIIYNSSQYSIELHGTFCSWPIWINLLAYTLAFWLCNAQAQSYAGYGDGPNLKGVNQNYFPQRLWHMYMNKSITKWASDSLVSMQLDRYCNRPFGPAF